MPKKITILVEGDTEKVFKRSLLNFLAERLDKSMPNLSFRTFDSRLPKGDQLKRRVLCYLNGPDPSDCVIALTDVYTGQGDFIDAAEAKKKMREWVGAEPRFFPHAAQYEFEAWLIPYWQRIQELAGHRKAKPSGNPEAVNHNNPPAQRIREIFEAGTSRDSYVKTRDVLRILKNQDLVVAIRECSELKAFVNTIISQSGGKPIP